MREVRSQEWGTFCQKLNEFESGATMTLELTGQDGARREIARNVPFDHMEFGKLNGCSDRISISNRASPGLPHEIIEPIHVLLKEAEGGNGFQSVMIQAEEGITTLTFHPMIRAAWLEELRLQ